MATTIEDLLDKIYWGSGSQAEKGSRFEALMVAYLQTAAEYEGRFSDVKRWQEWEGRQGKADHGIDIVARDAATGGWCAVQCKFYDPDHHLNKPDIDSFLSASGKEGFTSRLIVSTTDKWGKNAEDALAGQQVQTQRIGLADLLASNIDWDHVDFERPLQLPTTDKKRLRPHQQAALDDVVEGLGTHDRGKLVMACGTGKTFTALKIAEHLATSRKSEPTSVLFLVPSISLLNQSLREWKSESEIPFRAFAVCSDTKVGKRTEDISTHDLVHPATTDVARLAEQLRAASDDDRFTVVFSTYQSLDVVAGAQTGGSAPAFDLIVCDEAHRTTGVTLADDLESQFVRVHDNTYLQGVKRLYMTATPRLFDPKVKEKAKESNAVLASMDDEGVFGPELHRLGFGDAVSRDLLTDYKVLVLAVDEQYVAENFQQQIAESGEINLGDAAKIVGCWNGLAKHFEPGSVEAAGAGRPMRRAVAFAKDIRSSKAVTAAFPDVVDKHLAAASGGDGPRVEVQHVDGTQNAMLRGHALEWLKEGAKESDDVCRILSNARCLSEGVDVPALDAVMFLTPRSSVVDVVQSVGRVMRKSPGKDVGYIILPIVVPAGVAPEVALRDNARYAVVWQVLQALRAHDDRFNAMINQIDLNANRPDRVRIIGVPGGDDGEDGSGGDPQQLTLSFDVGEWRDAIYAKIVAKCGERRYWETWAKDIAEIARVHVERIRGLLADPASSASKEFAAFLDGLRGNLNDGITADDAIEMLAQHLITRPVFDALFEGYEFGTRNPVARSMEQMLAVLDQHALGTEQLTLESFYESVRVRAQGVDNAEARQKIIVELYDKFFATAFKRTVDKLGIVYTPVEIVDFILRSADEVLRAEFGQGLTDEGVHVLDGFTGTGTFMTRLLQLGLIEPHDLARKYASELHANEILLLAYYIAAVNIETVYQDVAREQLGQDEYVPFPGLVLADTFQMYEDGDEDDLFVIPENNERLNRQRELPITVIVGNPPYSSGQDSANDANPNERYTSLDAAIRDTYAARSSATLKNSLYDSYIRAIKWASLRIGDRGVIAFVTNGGFLDSNTADGMRLSLAEEFSTIHILNLRGNQRTAGEQSRREGGKVFGGGSRATVAITVLTKRPDHVGPAAIRYADVGDYLSREQKLARVADAESVAGLGSVSMSANEHGDWLNQRRDDFAQFMPIASRDFSAVFGVSSGGVKSNRDPWVYSFSMPRVQDRLDAMVSYYNNKLFEYASSGEGAPHEWIERDSTRFAWDRSDFVRMQRGIRHVVEPGGFRIGCYRPFTRMRLYLDRKLNNTIYQQARLFPTPQHRNFGIAVTGVASHFNFAAIATDAVPDFHVLDTGQFFARWRYEPVDADDGTLQLDAAQSEGEVVDGYRRIDNITDEALGRFQAAYGETFTKDDVFAYVYGLLHSPQYRETYAADLKKTLPRIPLVQDAQPFVDAGRRLTDLHLGYEQAEPYPLAGLDVTGPGGDADYEFFAVDKMRFTKVRENGKLVADRSTIVFNERITLSGVPEEAYRYQLGSRSAVEWILDRYQVRTDKASGIVNDPNDWSREVGDPRYVIDLLARIVTVSLETMQVVDALPALDIREDPRLEEAPWPESVQRR